MKRLFKRMSSIGFMLKIRKMQKNIKTPFLLLVGKYDRAIPSQHSLNAFKRYYKDNLNYFMFENSGHLCFEEETDLFVNKIIEFAKK
jgi:pimeloyl-ACP methyl ester carboxylesterase